MVPHQPVHQLSPSKEGEKRTASTTIECYRCGGNHYETKCKFINVDCRSCGKKAHLARVCRTLSKQSKSTARTSTSRGQSTHTLEHLKPNQTCPQYPQTRLINPIRPTQCLLFLGRASPLWLL